MRKHVVWMGLAAAVAGVISGCSALDLGPEPSNFVGPGSRAIAPLTDPDLDAVTPTAGSNATSEAVVPATMAWGGAPETMPSATQPTTTRPSAATNPATQPGLGQGISSQPALGKMAVPAAVTLQDSILLGLQNNTGLKVQRYNVPIQRTVEEIQRSVFDPTVSGQISGGRTGVPVNKGTTYTDSINAQIAAQEFFPTGTTVSASLSTNNAFYTDAASNVGANATITQALLRGAGMDVNLASLRQSQLDTQSTQYELRGFAEAMVDQIEQTYWDLAFAERQVVIVQNALDVAEEQLRSTNAIIKVGRIAPTEQAAAEAEVALRKENLINAKSTLETTRINFLRLITPPGEPFWNRTVTLHTVPFVPAGKMDPVDRHVEVALRMRPEINQVKLQIQRGDLQVVKTKNGLLPQLDLFITLGQTGYAKSFGSAAVNLADGEDYTALIGVRGSYALENRAARGAYHAAVLSREQSQDSLKNLEQTVQVDVRTQYIEAERTRQQIDATRATRVAQETALRVEIGKFRAGNSTSLLVAQAQRDLLAAQLSEVQALTGHLKSLVELYRLEGSLLYRRGLEAPGGSPVKELAWKRKR